MTGISVRTVFPNITCFSLYGVSRSLSVCVSERLSSHIGGVNISDVWARGSFTAPTLRGGLAEGHSFPQLPACCARGCQRGYLGPPGAEVRGLQRVVCRLGRQPGWEERWRFAAVPPPRACPCRAGCWDRWLPEVPADLVCLLQVWLS